jgi:DTW domain-containing protein YfiP
VPLKKGEVVRGEPQKVCLRCKKRQWMCTCWKLMKGKYYA